MLARKTQGVYLNADTPMPLASVVKVLHLVAYAEAVAAGELDPTQTVPLVDLEAFYLPNIDLGAHPRALTQLEDNGRIFGTPPAILLDEVPGMMIANSSNAATDYLHLLLGQRTLEETAVSLGLTSQTAPCPFLGQFLAMGNHAMLQNNGYQAWERYIADPQSYGRDAMLLTENFSGDAEFRQTAVEWRRRTRQPSGQTQRLFQQGFQCPGQRGRLRQLSWHESPKTASATATAALLPAVSWNGPCASPIIRRCSVTWVIRMVRCPGILTTVYYAYPKGETSPHRRRSILS